MSVKPGKFLTLEGGEGVGKTTNVAFIKHYLESHGIDLMLTREPGGTPLAEAVRELLLNKSYKGMNSDAELLLVFAARAEHLNRKILPAMKAGQWVLSDRFTDASFAYQGRGRELGFERIELLEKFVQKGFQPDMTLLLDADVALGMSRVEQRDEKDRFESEQMDFFNRVREGYLARASKDPNRMKIINAALPLEGVQKQIQTQLDELIARD